MIKRLLPYPLLFVGLLLMWVLLQQAAGPGQLLLGLAIAFGATHVMATLVPQRPRVRRLDRALVLIGHVLVDVLRSNLAVSSVILQGRRRQVTSGFLRLPLELQDRTGLALLACILTAVPGSAWLEHRAADNSVLIHVLDLKDEQEWITIVKQRYEALLLEIFQ
ncbi:MAG: Na+/H+ antiporter subunit [Devosia sp.]|nr:Na+/H+ antiporter subunit [Devosia sp.]